MKKKNVLVIYPIEWYSDLISEIQENSADELYVTQNLEQVKAMAKGGEINRVGIINMSFNKDGKGSAEEIHQANPDVEVMVWNGRSLGEKGIEGIKNPKEYYLEANSTDQDYAYDIVQKTAAEFFNGAECTKIKDVCWI